MLGEKSERFDDEFAFAEQHRARFGHPERGAHDADIDIVELARVLHVRERPIASHLGGGRYEGARLGEESAHERVRIAARLQRGHLAAHALQRGGEVCERCGALGLLLPLVAPALMLANRLPRTVLPALLVVAGGFTLRWVMVNAGQMSHLIATTAVTP